MRFRPSLLSLVPTLPKAFRRLALPLPLCALPMVLAGAAAISACDRAPSAQGLKEWSPADHDQEQGRPATNQAPRSDAGGAATLVDLTWQNQCATCHGLGGHGDGPQGPMFKASDLSREDWQGRTKDDEIAGVITNGKGRMPKFELPDEVVRGLVQRIRTFRGR